MKYIDAEKLLSEIERRLNIVEPHKGTFESAAACRQELIWMKDFITSLQQAQPEMDLAINLWNEVENFCLEYDARKDAWYNMTPRDQKLLNNPTWLNFAMNIARHFYELGFKARKEE